MKNNDDRDRQGKSKRQVKASYIGSSLAIAGTIIILLYHLIINLFL